MNLISAIYDYIRNHTYAPERAHKYRTLPHGRVSALLGWLEDGRRVVGDAYGDS
jgi:hypothetical protein